MWHSQRIVGDYLEHRLILLDLDSGEKTLLVGPGLLPRSHVTQSVSGLNTPAVYGFLPDGSGAVVEIRRVISIVDTRTGELEPITEPLPDRLTWFSPDLRGREHFSPDRRRFLERSKLGINVHVRGRSRTIYRGYSSRPWWLDDDWVMVTEPKRILLVAADGTQTRVLLDLSRGASLHIQ